MWRLIQAFVGDPIEGDEAKDRAKFVGKAIIYGVLTVTAIKVTIDDVDGAGRIRRRRRTPATSSSSRRRRRCSTCRPGG